MQTIQSQTLFLIFEDVRLQFEFYTFDSIQEDLKKIFGDQVKQYNMSIYKKWSQIRQDQDKDRETKFFTYIKFFIEKKTNKTYGLIGGKTNYNNPDISLHDEIGRAHV